MSRRRQSRAVEAAEAVETSERWADAPASRVPEDWRSEWAEITLDVVHRAWSRWGARIYFHPRDLMLRDDLKSWLLVEAEKIAATYTPSETSEAPEQMWGAYLWKTLGYRARYHFSEVVGRSDGPSGMAARDAYLKGIDSTDRLDDHDAVSGFRTVRHALHGDDLFARDPCVVIIALEDIERHIAEVDDWQRVADANGGRYVVESSECEITGCHAPRFQSRTVCRRHYDQERNLWREPSEVECNIPDCHLPLNAVGLCGPHMAKHYKGKLPPELAQYVIPKAQPKAEQGCSVEGCPEVVGPKGAHGMCSRHYQQWRRGRLEVAG